jgi:hypothetical protein
MSQEFIEWLLGELDCTNRFGLILIFSIRLVNVPEVFAFQPYGTTAAQGKPSRPFMTSSPPN